MKNNIILIGFMGVGKGTLSRALAKKTGMIALDTDDMIESMENEKIKTIFKKHGEKYFRNRENQVALWASKNVNNAIISTGGGFPIYAEDIQKMGKVFYLKTSFDGILKKMLHAPNSKKKLKKRPLFKNPESAKKLFNSRLETYEKKADYVIEVENKTTDEIAEIILKEMAKK